MVGDTAALCIRTRYYYATPDWSFLTKGPHFEQNMIIVSCPKLSSPDPEVQSGSKNYTTRLAAAVVKTSTGLVVYTVIGMEESH